MKTASRLFTRIAKGAALAAGAVFTAKAISGSFRSIQLRDRVVLITGGSRGLGLVLARHLAGEGAKVAICSRTKESLSRASDDLSPRTSDFLALHCDVTDQQQVKQMVQQVREKMGGVDILINNAGIIRVGPVETMNKKDYEDAMNVHMWGPWHTMHEVLPDMIAQKGGRIVNIVSIAGKISVPHLLPYNASKYALSGLSEGMAAELRKYNIHVTTVYPGLMRTGSPRNIDVKGQHQKEYAWFKILDSLPFLSIDVDRAAHQIIEAMKKGHKTLTLTIPAKFAIAAHGIAPSLTTTAFSLINSLLPGKGSSRGSRKGYESSSGLSESFLTEKTDKAAQHTLQK